MYVDSGADISLIPRQFGDALGLEPRKNDLQEISGIGRKPVPVLITKVDMKIGRKPLETRIAWSMIEDVPLILGRMDVFDAFTIRFDQKNNIVEFKPH